MLQLVSLPAFMLLSSYEFPGFDGWLTTWQWFFPYFFYFTRFSTCSFLGLCVPRLGLCEVWEFLSITSAVRSLTIPTSLILPVTPFCVILLLFSLSFLNPVFLFLRVAQIFLPIEQHWNTVGPDVSCSIYKSILPPFFYTHSHTRPTRHLLIVKSIIQARVSKCLLESLWKSI